MEIPSWKHFARAFEGILQSEESVTPIATVKRLIFSSSLSFHFADENDFGPIKLSCMEKQITALHQWNKTCTDNMRRGVSRTFKSFDMPLFIARKILVELMSFYKSPAAWN